MTGRYMPGMLRRREIDAYGFAEIASMFLFGSCAFILLSAAFQGDERSGFFFANSLLSVYLGFEAWRSLQKRNPLILIAPPFLTTFLYFFLSHVLPAVARVPFPEIDDQPATLAVTYWEEMASQGLWAVAAAFAMWRTYEWAGGPAKAVRNMLMSTGFIRTSLAPNIIAALIGQVIFFGCVGYMIWAGVYGFASTTESRAAQLNLMQLLNIGLGVGQLSMFLLIVAALMRLKAGQQAPGLVMLAAAALIIQVGAGAVAGFKSQIFMPFAVAGLAYFFVYARIPIAAVFVAIAAIFVSYAVVEPYRQYLMRSDIQGQGGADLITALQESWTQREANIADDRSIAEQASARFDLAAVTAVSMAYADAGMLRQEDRAWLWESVYIAPIFAFVPRAVWPDKPMYSTGLWFSQNVWGRWNDDATSVGMGPISFMYFVGGGLGVSIGFAAIGMLQAMLFRGIASIGPGGLLTYVIAANSLIFLPSDIGAGFAGFLQILPIALLAQYLFLKPSQRRPAPQ